MVEMYNPEAFFGVSLKNNLLIEGNFEELIHNLGFYYET